MKAYAIEDAVFSRRNKPLTMQEARDLAAKLFAHFGVEPIVVKRAVGTAGQRSSSHFWHPHKERPARIHLDILAPDWIICHEVAHYVNFTRGAKGHGKAWAAIYVEAVRVVISDTYANRLEAKFAKGGLRG